MEEQEDDHIEPPVPAIFELDLGANGGIFAPKTAQEMQDWLEGQLTFWRWAQNVPSTSHKNTFDNALRPLQAALVQAKEAVQYQAQGNEATFRARATQVRAHVEDALLNRKLPHSAAPLGKRIADLKEDPRAAMAYLFPFLQEIPGHEYQFDVRDLSSWRGFVMGLMERFNMVTEVEPRIQAERTALEDLHARAEQLFGEKQAAVDQLHRDFASTTEAIGEAKTAHQADVDELIFTSNAAHEAALEKHSAEMENLRKTFRESMTLRGPVEYWAAKAVRHEQKASSLMKWVFGLMAGLGAILGGVSIWVFWTLTDGKPDSWKVAVLVLVGVLGVWAIRLVVRMFLSHTHLAADAEERVTMVKTYLALLEGEKMPADEDRKLVLAPLFRPASDGMVKDEGLPHPMLELFTRAGPR